VIGWGSAGRCRPLLSLALAAVGTWPGPLASCATDAFVPVPAERLLARLDRGRSDQPAAISGRAVGQVSRRRWAVHTAAEYATIGIS